MTCKPGQWVLIAFPFSDMSHQKKRPVLVLSAPDQFGDFIGLGVTTSPSHQRSIPINAISLQHGMLPKPSWIRTDKIYTLGSRNIVRTFAEVNPMILDQAVSDLCLHLGESPK